MSAAFARIYARDANVYPMKRTDRMFAIVVDLQARKILRAEDLAERYETSVRTIYRDVSALCEAGVPVISLPGQGYALPPTYFLPPLTFGYEEAVSLLLGTDYIAQTFDSAYRAAALAAGRKIEAIVPPALREALDAARRGIRLMGGSTDPRKLELLEVFRAAIAERRVVRFRYRGQRTDDAEGRGELARSTAPYALAHMSGQWYVVGHSYERDSLRRFRLSRIDDVVVLTERFVLPGDFRLEAPNPQSDLPVLVSLTFDETEMLLMQERLSGFDATLQFDVPRCTATFRTHSEAGIASYILSWGSGVQVIEPVSLRERVVDEARRIVEFATDTTVSAASR